MDKRLFSVTPIEFDSYIGKSIETFPSDLYDFCFGDPQQPLAPTIKKGAQALRIGYYKVINQPLIREYYNGIDVFAAYVLFFKDGYLSPIKYYANIGPLLNFHAKYQNDNTKAWDYLIRSGKFSNKDKFFESLQGKEFEVLKDEWEFSQKFNTNVKKMTWEYLPM